MFRSSNTTYIFLGFIAILMWNSFLIHRDVNGIKSTLPSVTRNE